MSGRYRPPSHIVIRPLFTGNGSVSSVCSALSNAGLWPIPAREMDRRSSLSCSCGGGQSPPWIA
jgi:hypothetical protein